MMLINPVKSCKAGIVPIRSQRNIKKRFHPDEIKKEISLGRRDKYIGIISQGEH